MHLSRACSPGLEQSGWPVVLNLRPGLVGFVSKNGRKLQCQWQIEDESQHHTQRRARIVQDGGSQAAHVLISFIRSARVRFMNLTDQRTSIATLYPLNLQVCATAASSYDTQLILAQRRETTSNYYAHSRHPSCSRSRVLIALHLS